MMRRERPSALHTHVDRCPSACSAKSSPSRRYIQPEQSQQRATCQLADELVAESGPTRHAGCRQDSTSRRPRRRFSSVSIVRCWLAGDGDGDGEDGERGRWTHGDRRPETPCGKKGWQTCEATVLRLCTGMYIHTLGTPYISGRRRHVDKPAGCRCLGPGVATRDGTIARLQ